MSVNTAMPKKHEVPEELLSSLLANCQKPEDLIGENGLLRQLTKLLVEKALDTDLTHHLGHDRHEAVANVGGSTHNGKSKNPLKGEYGHRPFKYPGTAMAALSPNCFPSTRPVGLALTTKSSLCTPEAWRCVRFKATSKRCTPQK